MDQEQRATHDANDLRQRLVLTVVEPPEAAGFPLATADGVAYRGSGDLDLACGRCGELLAVGVESGPYFRALLYCDCGALNSSC